jgi:hypothetical protein
MFNCHQTVGSSCLCCRVKVRVGGGEETFIQWQSTVAQYTKLVQIGRSNVVLARRCHGMARPPKDPTMLPGAMLPRNMRHRIPPGSGPGSCGGAEACRPAVTPSSRKAGSMAAYAIAHPSIRPEDRVSCRYAGMPSRPTDALSATNADSRPRALGPSRSRGPRRRQPRLCRAWTASVQENAYSPTHSALKSGRWTVAGTIIEFRTSTRFIELPARVEVGLFPSRRTGFALALVGSREGTESR